MQRTTKLRVFLSSSSADSGLVDLLVRLLRFHGAQCWCSNDGLAGGDDWRRVLEQTLRACSHLVLVVSKSAASSEWINRELSFFRSSDAERRIVPLLLDATPTSTIDPMLDRIQHVDCRGSLAAGIEDLFAALDLWVPAPRLHARHRSPISW